MVVGGATSHAPIAANDSIAVHGVGTSLTFDPRVNDGDFDLDPLTITAVTTPSHGTAAVAGGGTGLAYTRTSAGADCFTYTISDGKGHTATATVTVTDPAPPAPTNVAPNAVNDNIVVNGIGDTTTFDPRVNDSDFDADTLTVTTVSTPLHGTAIVVGGKITYTRTSAGDDSFTYTISDGHSHSATATIRVTGGIAASGGAPSQYLTTRYVYDAESHLRFVVSAQGEVTEYDYDTQDRQITAVTYRNNTYNINGLGPTATLSESGLIAWTQSISDQSTVERVDTSYDFRGNVMTIKAYTAVSSAGIGLTTQPYITVNYIYDQFGNLLNRQTSGITNSEVFTYDGLGRVKTSTDLNNTTTTVAFNDGANVSTVTLASGLVKTATYNYAGELLTYAESGLALPTATTTYSYDELGRLRMTTDAMGNKSYYLYDHVGRKIADVAADPAAPTKKTISYIEH